METIIISFAGGLLVGLLLAASVRLLFGDRERPSKPLADARDRRAQDVAAALALKAKGR